MERADIVIIGGSAAGATAAVSCKRRNPGKSITVIRQEEQVSIPCGIPYIFGTLGSPQKNLIPDTLLTSNGVQIVISAAEKIDRKRKLVHTAKGEQISYDRLILATGSSPVVLPIPGIEKENVFIVKKEVGYLQKMLEEVNKSSDIVIIGGGFIGAEFADECKKNRQANVTIIEKLPHCLQLAFDDELCIEAEKVLKDRGIKIVGNDTVAAILGDNKVKSVRLTGSEIKADVVIVSTGVSPNTELAARAGLRVDDMTGGIVVDRYQRVEGDADILACGDCAMKVSYYNGKPLKTWLASIATNEARLAASNVFVTQYAGLGVVGVFSTQIGELAIAAAGLTERQALAEGYDIVVGQAKAPSKHPGGMPGAVPTSVKLIFSKNNGVMLGGEASGSISVGELINVISACIQHNMTAYQVSLFQMGTHPALCASPIAYQTVNAAEEAVMKLR
ncbi:MAG: FAD-dependent oxidoreductase [Thermodesulfobacteriota bacterium]|jgi:NADPH-dependent 2,4-dienoyl-CoA reductase/sulfur reductase-like enzyme